MLLAVQLAGPLACYRFEAWERHARVPGLADAEQPEGERLRFVDEGEARRFMDARVRDEGTIALRPLLLGLGGFGSGEAARASLVRALVSGRVIVTRVPRVPMASDEVELTLYEPERPEPAPMDLDEPRAEARLEVQAPTKVRAEIGRQLPPRGVGTVAPQPRRLVASVAVRTPQTLATIAPKIVRTRARVGGDGGGTDGGPELAGTNISDSPRSGSGGGSKKATATIEPGTRRVRATVAFTKK